ncbi:MAG: hypothetical protein CML19_18155 [Pusillimonas sp.]|jgi:hypothetical protein|nr:hypothetical protein [Pusillimonas sp.]|tara:strand:- start:19573 stop:19983 length:411 start_codon:yes stop_codon:yes gene_type:complete
MTALANDRNTPRIDGQLFEFPMKAAVLGYVGAIAVLNAGLLQPGATATGLVAVGIFTERADNSDGANSAITGKVRPGVFRFNNSASSDAITAAEIGSACYIVDDQTVAKTDGSSARSKAGTIVNVDDQGVWVRIGV